MDGFLIFVSIVVFVFFVEIFMMMLFVRMMRFLLSINWGVGVFKLVMIELIIVLFFVI